MTTAQNLILVIEDSAMMLTSIEERFEFHAPTGWGLLTAPSTDIARELIKEHAEKIRIITFDHSVPGDDGTTLLLIQEVVANRRINALLIAASSMMNKNQDLMDFGAHIPLRKMHLPSSLIRFANAFNAIGGIYQMRVTTDAGIFLKDSDHQKQLLMYQYPYFMRTGTFPLAPDADPVNWYFILSDLVDLDGNLEPHIGLDVAAMQHLARQGKVKLLQIPLAH